MVLISSRDVVGSRLHIRDALLRKREVYTCNKELLPISVRGRSGGQLHFASGSVKETSVVTEGLQTPMHFEGISDLQCCVSHVFS